MESIENTVVHTEESSEQVKAEETQIAAGPKAEEKNVSGDVGYGTFFGSELLFSLPVIGLISTIVMTAVAKRKSLKNYALAKMTWILTKAALSIISVCLILVIVGNSVVATINSSLGTNFGNIFGLVRTVINVSNGRYSSLISQLGSVVPEELRSFIEELGSGEYDELLEMFDNKEYAALVEELKSEKYPQLVNKLDSDTFNMVVDELEKAANGEILPWMEELDNITNNVLSNFLG
ncbi:MAG: hypothetical protein IJ027_00345 [Oscillospiraceae bacterium]|nr:hypothetical protein [Oscillospiraceae bacterium]